MAVKKGDKIKVEYTGTLADGTVFDASEKHGQPLAFEVGAGQLIKGFDEAVVGMETGEEKTITLESREAYGDVNPDMIKSIPKNTIPNSDQLKKGMVLGLTAPDGMQFPAVVADVTTDTVSLDLNHPLAGKALTFKIKVVEIA